MPEIGDIYSSSLKCCLRLCVLTRMYQVYHQVNVLNIYWNGLLQPIISDDLSQFYLFR